MTTRQLALCLIDDEHITDLTRLRDWTLPEARIEKSNSSETSGTKEPYTYGRAVALRNKRIWEDTLKKKRKIGS